MSTNSTLSSLPNPFTPLAFLHPDIAEQFQAQIYLAIASLSAFIWDWLSSSREEISMCRKKKITFAVVIYFLSRLCTLANGKTILLLIAAPVPNCTALKYACAVSCILAAPLTSTLFFFRVKAVYCDNRIITAFFGFSLFSLFGLSFLYPFAYESSHLGTTQRCISTRFASYASAPAVMNSAIDTLVFIAISLRIVSFSITGDTLIARMSSFLRGDGLPYFSRSFLQGGQLYYLATIWLNIVVIAMALAPLSAPYRTMFIAPHIALNNAMACRVFRGIKLGLIQDVDLATITSAPHSNTRCFAYSQKTPAPGIVHGFEGSPQSSVTVEIMATTETYVYSERDPGHPYYHDRHNRDDGISDSEVNLDRV